jgi:AraC-like DNA-binding protein
MHQEINQQRIHNVCLILMEMAGGNFTYRLPRTGEDDELEALTVLVNWLAEEMKESVFHSGYINPHFTYRYVVQSSYMLDYNFVIKSFSPDVPELLGFDSNELLDKDFTKILTKDSLVLLGAVKEKLVQNESYQTTLPLQFVTHDKLLLPLYCSISTLFRCGRIIVSSFAAIVQEQMEDKSVAADVSAEEAEKIDIKQIQAVYDYILAHMDSSLPTLKELSRIFGTNEFKLKNGFKHLFKTTIFQFNNDERLKRSHLVIEQTKIPLKNIASMAGFSTYPNFSRAFKIKFGYSPTDIPRRPSGE